MGHTVRIESPFPPYFVDCYIKELHLGFEADGKPFHNPRKDRERDNELLHAYDLRVLHLTEDELKTKAGKDEARKKIEEFIEKYGH
jgi:very-short-patch-repair endonuclease